MTKPPLEQRQQVVPKTSKPKSKIWQLGNTSVRSALRLKYGLEAYANSNLVGQIRGVEGDAQFRQVLGQSGFINLGEDATVSLGRKWRDALGNKMGFIYPESFKDQGCLDLITPAGYHLLQADSIQAINEVFLRQLLVPTKLTEVEEHGEVILARFSPLLHVLDVLKALPSVKMESYLSMEEFAFFVQVGCQPTEQVISEIVQYRAQEQAHTGSLKRFRSAKYAEFGKVFGLVPQSIRDYADMNLRYLRATGLFTTKARGIMLAEATASMVSGLMKYKVSTGRPLYGIKAYYEDAHLAQEVKLLHVQGAKLPTDNLRVAKEALTEVMSRLVEREHDSLGKAEITKQVKQLQAQQATAESVVEVNRIRHSAQEALQNLQEQEFAQSQHQQLELILLYLETLAQRKPNFRYGDEVYKIPQGEAPAYFEWLLWRLLLCFSDLQTEPHQVRRFKVDSDLLPLSTAPGNTADLVSEFPDYVLAVEVTLTESSRQEAAEGESVRRHISDLVDQHDKPVLGLFVARRVDLNTYETFRHSTWYTTNEQKRVLSVVPLTIEQLISVVRSYLATPEFHQTSQLSSKLFWDQAKKVLLTKNELDAIEWREQIAKL